MYESDTEIKDMEKTRPHPFKFEKLARLYIDHLMQAGRYPLFHRSKFYLYDGTRYLEEPELCGRLRTFLRDRKKAQSNNVIGNVVPIIQNYGQKFTADHPAMPFYVGKEPWPDPKNIIAYKNGLLDLGKCLTGDVSLISHTPKWCSTFALPFDFDLAATCPSWLEFLAQVFEGDDNPMSLLQEFFGYCLSQDTSLQKALMQVGKRRAGKGTTQYILQQLLGVDNWTAYDLGALARDFGLTALEGKAVAFVGEVELSGHPQRTVIMERLKGIIGEDVQQINVKYDPVQRSVRLPTRFVIACNEMPTFFDPSGAIGSRFLFLHYQRSFAGQEDIGLKERLAGELPGINNWALAGLVRLRAAGGRFTVPETTRQLQAEFDRRSCPVASFIKDMLAVQQCYDPGDLHGAVIVDTPIMIEKQRCYDLYCEWCQEHDMQPANASYFGRDVQSVLPKMPKNARPLINGKRTWVYVGIGTRLVLEATQDSTTTLSAGTPGLALNVPLAGIV